MITYILKNHATRDDPRAVEWTSICHNKEACWVVHYQATRELSRWNHTIRARPWMVYRCTHKPGLSSPWSSHKTLELALAAIKRDGRD